MEKFNNGNIKRAVGLYIADSKVGKDKYGDISTWDVSQVTDMSGLFDGKIIKGLDLSNWDVSNVKSMLGMFARSYIGPSNGIQNWIPKNLEDCDYMFVDALWGGEINNFTLNSFSSNEKKFQTYGMFNNFSCDHSKSVGVEVDITSWNSSIMDEDNCFGMFGGEYIRYSNDFLENMKSWCFTEFAWSTISFEQLFINYNVE